MHPRGNRFALASKPQAITNLAHTMQQWHAPKRGQGRVGRCQVGGRLRGVHLPGRRHHRKAVHPWAPLAHAPQRARLAAPDPVPSAVHPLLPRRREARGAPAPPRCARDAYPTQHAALAMAVAAVAKPAWARCRALLTKPRRRLGLTPPPVLPWARQTRPSLRALASCRRAQSRDPPPPWL